MIVALLQTFTVVFAAACGFAVYRTRQSRPVLRGLVTFGALLVVPAISFWLFALVMTSRLPVVAVVPPLALFGVGLYVVAEGVSLPRQPRAGAE